jgi:hypothetical protein
VTAERFMSKTPMTVIGGTKPTCGSNRMMSASEGRTDLLFKWGHFRF